MRELIFNIFLDMHTHISQNVIKVKKEDSKNRIIVHLLEYNKPYVITERSYAVFAAKKPDGNGIVNDCEIIDNTIQYTLTGQTTSCVGSVECELRLYDEDGNLLSTPRFTVLVDDTIFSSIEDNIESTYEAGTLDRLITEGNAFIDEAEAVLNEANEASNKVNKYLKLTDLEKVVGASAYEIAVSNGFEGTEEEWLDSLKGEGIDLDLIRYGEVENSIEIGETAKTVTPNSIAAGANSVAGCRGYYISAIDTTNKHIYLAKEKTADPVITTGDEYYDANFETPAYLDGVSSQTLEITEDNPISKYFDIEVRGGMGDEKHNITYNTVAHTGELSGIYLTALYDCDIVISAEIDRFVSVGDVSTDYAKWEEKSFSLKAGDIIKVGGYGDKVIFHKITLETTAPVEFCIKNGKHYAFCGEIVSVDHNRVTYAEALPFDSIVASGDNEEDFLGDHLFYVPTSPHVGSITELFTGAFVVGEENFSAGANGFVGGFQNILGGNFGAIFGRNNKGGYACMIGGSDNDSSGVTSTTFGRDNVNKGWCCYVGGRYNTIERPEIREDGYPLTNMYHTVIGSRNTVGGGNAQFVGGQLNTSNGSRDFVHGYENTNDGDDNIVIGTNLVNKGNRNFVTGHENTNEGDCNRVGGHHNTNNGTYNDVIGYYNISGGENNHTEGSNNTNNGKACHVGGYGNTDNGEHNYTIGRDNTNNGARGVVGGYGNNVEKGEHANAYGNAVFGARNTVKGALHFVTGSDHNIDSAGRVMVWGRGNISKAAIQQVGGQYNEQNDDALMVIGNGTSVTKRSNALEVYKTHTKVKAVTVTESCVRNILFGTELPDDSVGNDGDIYIMYEE